MDALKSMVDEIAGILGIPVAAVELFNEATQAMQFRVIHGMELLEADIELQMPLEFALSGTVVQTNAPLLETNPERSGEFWISRGMKSYLGFPMSTGGRCLGTLSLAHPESVELDPVFHKCAVMTAQWLAQFIEGRLFRESGEPAGVILQKLRSEYDRDVRRLNNELRQRELELKALALKSRAANEELARTRRVQEQSKTQFAQTAAEREELERLRKDFEQIDRELRDTQQALRSQTMQDELTGLPNDALFRYLFAQGLARSRRQKEMIGVLFIDIDHFQRVRSEAGERAADGFLRQIADRLRRNVREGDTVARVGLDEFVWSISNLQDMEDLAIIAEKMLAIARRPVQFDGRDYQLTASIGISVFPFDGGEPDILQQQAITALIRAKELGRDTYQFYTEEVNLRLRERLVLKQQLHEALSKHEFVLHYQPVVSVNAHRMEGVEALLRWKNPDGKLAYPEEFLKVSEDTGLIAPLDEWVLRTACQQMQKWAGFGRGSALLLAVNISQRLFQQIDFPVKVAAILRETGFPAHRLELEVREKSLVADMEKSIHSARGLRDLGVRLSIDDFGTGALSLNQLKLLPVSTLKMDPAFTRSLPSDAANASMVAGMISLAHTMRLRVVAEGLENESELQYLRTLKCDMFQGHLFRPPVPVEGITDLLQGETAEFEVEVSIESEEELVFEDVVQTVPMTPVLSGSQKEQQYSMMSPPAPQVEAVRHVLSKNYVVLCTNCRNQFDAMDTAWCSCLVTERTLVCPHCMDCFCKAALEFKLDFWTEAPQSMWDRRIQEEARFAEVKPNPTPDDVKRPIVLVLDDERPILSMAAHLITGLGYSVITGTNGEEGLDLARAYVPDLILSDALMPRMDGREMCRKIKSDPNLGKVKVIIMTSLSTRPRDRSTAFKEFRMDEYLQKPLAYKQLREVLEKYLA